MHISRFFQRAVLVAATAATVFVGLPASQAATPGSAVCTVVGNKAGSFSTMDLSCTGTPDVAGAWHLDDDAGVINGRGPNGATVTGVTIANPICVWVGGAYRICKTVRIRVCDQSGCRTYTVTICVWVYTPSVEVCVEYFAAAGAFDGDAVFTPDTATTTPAGGLSSGAVGSAAR
jgi:hypothetical protein